MEGLFGRDQTCGLQQSLVGSKIEISGRRTASSAQRGGFRSRRKVSRARQRALHALLPGFYLSVPVLSRVVQRGRIYRPAQPLHLLRFEGSRSEIQQDVGDGPEQAVAGRDAGIN